MITRKTAKTGARTWLASHRWRYNWLRESLMMQGTRGAAGRRAALLADIREDVDSVIDTFLAASGITRDASDEA